MLNLLWPLGLIVERQGRRLVMRLAQRSENSLLPIEARSPEPAQALLVPFGLGRREAEVLHWVTQGKTDADIGKILGLSPRTVQKHLERIYQKFGVENRTAAAAKVFEVASMAHR